MSAESIAPTTPSSQTSCCEPTCCSDSASEASPNSNSGADTQNGQTPLDPQLASTSTTEAPRADTPEEIRRAVREGYGQIARGQTQSCCGPSESCSGPEDGAESLARGVGYDEAELANLPDGANMGLSCGNPTALAQLALKYKCPVLPAQVERLGGAHFRVTIYPPLELPNSGDKQADIAAMTTTVNEHLGDWIKQRPEQWLWVHNRWPNEQESLPK